jgi:hypothetical protein
MNAKRASDYSSLPKDERRLVFFARRANADTIGGGCLALVWAEVQDHRDAERAVSAVYSRSSGRVPDHLDAWECGECGYVHYGREAADECCQPSDEWDDLDEGDEAE